MKDPTILKGDLRLREVIVASHHLEATYVMRLFAEFETGVRQYWEAARDSHPKMADLLTALASRCRVPPLKLLDAHRARTYRNSLVHEREGEVDEIPIATVRGYLCRFFSDLPEQW